MYEPGIEPNTLDISYSRWLMIHLNRPVDAMRAIYAALKPGGVMVCEEADISAVYAEPPSPAYNEMRDGALAAGLARGVNYSGGRWAHTWAREAGFDIVHADAYHPHYLEGPHKGFWNWTLRNGCRRLVEEGTMTGARWTALVDGMTQADNSRETVVAHCRIAPGDRPQAILRPHPYMSELRMAGRWRSRSRLRAGCASRSETGTTASCWTEAS